MGVWVEEELASLTSVLLETEGVGDRSLRCFRGGDGNAMSTPRPENRSSGCSTAALDTGNRNVGREGTLATGKKSSKVRPSAPVRTTRLESLLRSAASLTCRLPRVTLALTFRLGEHVCGEYDDDEDEVERRPSSSSVTSGRI